MSQFNFATEGIFRILPNQKCVILTKITYLVQFNTVFPWLEYHTVQLCGTKLGCAEGGCGACTVMVSKFDRVASKAVYPFLNKHHFLPLKKYFLHLFFLTKMIQPFGSQRLLGPRVLHARTGGHHRRGHRLNPWEAERRPRAARQKPRIPVRILHAWNCHVHVHFAKEPVQTQPRGFGNRLSR